MCVVYVACVVCAVSLLCVERLAPVQFHPSLCFRHAGRVARNAMPFLLPGFLLDLDLPAGSSSRILAASVRESTRSNKELTAS